MSLPPNELNPGKIILLGSGEIAPSARKIYDWLFQQLSPPVNVAILETPAGFEPNSAAVAGQVGLYLEKRLQNYKPQVTIVPARKRGTSFSPDDPEIAAPVSNADVIFMGPGSPTYAVRQLQDSYVWNALRARHHLGASLIFSSAATLACSEQTLPVYEIYKVGEELHWKPGLNFFDDYGLSLILIPHWNNSDGGDTLDTSRCYMGEKRYDALCELLPPDVQRASTIVGIDENTALVIDPAAATCRVLGQGRVSITRAGHEEIYGSDATLPIEALGAFRLPSLGGVLPPRLYQDLAQQQAGQPEEPAQAVDPPPAVMDLVQQRAQARANKQWDLADDLRDAIAAAGWQLMDTPDGPNLEPL
ncbi:MAG: cysteinyl-tRNA synthetase [Caldilineaceae bacterium]|nr:cysteinyl-tRNA synthetase [Caldilineaceae bacterium]